MVWVVRRGIRINIIEHTWRRAWRNGMVIVENGICDPCSNPERDFLRFPSANAFWKGMIQPILPHLL